MIIVFHALSFDVSGFNLKHPRIVGPILERLNVGVPIFFVLSGYLIGRPFVEKILSDQRLPPLRITYAKRLARVLPAYWVALVILTSLRAVTVPDASTFLRNFLLIHTYFPKTVFTGIIQAWTLSIEMSFYLALPLAFALLQPKLRRRSPKVRTQVLAGVCVVAMVARYPFWWLWSISEAAPLQTAHIWLPAYADTLAAGVLISVFMVASENFPKVARWRQVLSRFSVPILLSSAVTFFALSRIGLPLGPSLVSFRVQILGHLLYSLTAILFVFPFTITNITPSRVLRPIPWLSSISYGVYLWHRMLMSGGFADKLLPFEPKDGPVLIHLAIIISTSLFIGAISYRIVEKPIIDRVNRWAASRMPPPVEVQTRP